MHSLLPAFAMIGLLTIVAVGLAPYADRFREVVRGD